jgi:hypothetical protein
MLQPIASIDLDDIEDMQEPDSPMTPLPTTKSDSGHGAFVLTAGLTSMDIPPPLLFPTPTTSTAAQTESPDWAVSMAQPSPRVSLTSSHLTLMDTPTTAIQSGSSFRPPQTHSSPDILELSAEPASPVHTGILRVQSERATRVDTLDSHAKAGSDLFARLRSSSNPTALDDQDVQRQQTNTSSSRRDTNPVALNRALRRLVSTDV